MSLVLFSCKHVNAFLTGSSTSASKLADGLCGTAKTSEYVSTGRYVLVTFTSDTSSTDQGFQMTYLSAADTCKYYVILHFKCVGS